MPPAHVGRGWPDVPLPVRSGVVTALVLGALGGITGLAIGLRVYAPTAWFAAVEVGLPAAVLGGLVGSAVGAVVQLTRRRR